MTATHATTEITAQALAAELAVVWGTKLGGTADLTPAAGGAAAEAGWLITIAVGGGARGQLSVWFKTASVAEAMRAGLKLDADPKDDAVSALLCEVVTQSGRALLDKSGIARVTVSPACAEHGPAPAGATAFDLAVGGKTCPVQLIVAIGPAVAVADAGPTNSQRLEAVLDVDLPLIVRFGRATMPLRALAVLGPGSVIDMGRSPDEPVELIVGDRVIARGEVVIVGGNYGVRITDLTGSRLPEGELESRAR